VDTVTLGEVFLQVLQFLPTGIIALVHHSGIFIIDAINFRK